jgi:hypothetical protein
MIILGKARANSFEIRAVARVDYASAGSLDGRDANSELSGSHLPPTGKALLSENDVFFAPTKAFR